MLRNNKRRRQKKVSASDVRQSYTSEKARNDLVTDLWTYLVLRPVSFHLTPLFINLGFSANAVTALGLIPLLGGLVFSVSGAASPLNFIIGALFVNIWVLCDCVDGNIARFQGQTSKFGELFDSIVGMIFYGFLPVCLGLGLYLASSERSIVTLGLELPRWFWLLAGVAIWSARLLTKVVHLRARMIVGGKIAFPEDSKISIWAILPRAIVSFEAPLLLVASLAGMLGFWLLGYAAYNVVVFVGMTLLTLRKALLADKQQPNNGEGL